MHTQDSFSPARGAAIERFLTGIVARVHHQHRVSLPAGTTLSTLSPTGFGTPARSAALVYVIRGCVRLVHAASGEQIALCPGDAQLHTDGAPRTIIAEADSFVLISSLDLTDTTAEAATVLPASVTVHDLPGSDPAVAALAAMLGPSDLADAPPAAPTPQLPGGAIVCDLMATAVLLAVLRTWAVRGCAPATWPSRTNDPHLDLVVAAIEADPARAWSVAELARTGMMSRTVFTERFRTAMGMSPANYLTDVRIRSAQTLLAEGRAVTEVSRAIGYASDEGFSRAFRSRVGQTPSAWRRCATSAEVGDLVALNQ